MEGFQGCNGVEGINLENREVKEEKAFVMVELKKKQLNQQQDVEMK